MSLCLCGEQKISRLDVHFRGTAISVVSDASVISGFDFDVSFLKTLCLCASVVNKLFPRSRLPLQYALQYVVLLQPLGLRMEIQQHTVTQHGNI